jgi:hypothetical protein
MAKVHGGSGFLWALLQVLDDEELLVLDPALRRGYIVMISGIGDNFQLHTLLADALIGDPRHGWLPGRRPDPRVIAVARDAPLQEDEDSTMVAEGSFNMVNWTGLACDGTVLTGTGAHTHWIWGEGVPADILPFAGTRVILLAPPAYARSWNATRRFPLMPAELTVRRQLSLEEAETWLHRFATAPR